MTGQTASSHHPRFKPVFSGLRNSNCTEAFAPPSPADTSWVAASWKASRSKTGACMCHEKFWAGSRVSFLLCTCTAAMLALACSWIIEKGSVHELGGHEQSADKDCLHEKLLIDCRGSPYLALVCCLLEGLHHGRSYISLQFLRSSFGCIGS